MPLPASDPPLIEPFSARSVISVRVSAARADSPFTTIRGSTSLTSLVKRHVAVDTRRVDRPRDRQLWRQVTTGRQAGASNKRRQHPEIDVAIRDDGRLPIGEPHLPEHAERRALAAPAPRLDARRNRLCETKRVGTRCVTGSPAICRSRRVSVRSPVARDRSVDGVSTFSATSTVPARSSSVAGSSIPRRTAGVMPVAVACTDAGTGGRWSAPRR